MVPDVCQVLPDTRNIDSGDKDLCPQGAFFSITGARIIGLSIWGEKQNSFLSLHSLQK